MRNTDINNYYKEESREFNLICELEKAINDEWLAYYQYWTAYTIARGTGRFDAYPEFKEHASEEWKHIEKLSKRLMELGGSITLDPTHLKTKAHEWSPIESCETIDIIKDLKHAELGAIKNYEDLICSMQDKDPVTKKVLVDILAKEYEHYHDLDLLYCSIM